MKILGTGLDGLVGSRIVELLKDSYEFEFSTEDITNRDIIVEKIKSSSAEIVLHLAAKTDVDGCEKDREEDIRISGYQDIAEQEKAWRGKNTAWAVNVFGTQNVIEGTRVSNKKIIYISTDFVFSGDDCPPEGYSEEDMPSPINWYSRTKYEGEKAVQDSGIPWVIARIAYPYRASFERSDFLRSFINAFSEKRVLNVVADHIACPTFIDDIASALDVLIKKETHGIFHMVGSESITPYDAALLIAKSFGIDTSLMNKTTRENYFKNRAKRPFQLFLKNDKIEKLGVKMRTFEEGIIEIKNQMTNF